MTAFTYRIGRLSGTRGIGLALVMAAMTANPLTAAQPAAAPAAQPATPAPPAQSAAAPRPPSRPLPTRNVKIAVSVSLANEQGSGQPRTLTVTTAEGRYAQVRRQPGRDFLSLDATATVISDRQVLVEFKLSGSAAALPSAMAPGGPPMMGRDPEAISQEGAVLLTPGVKHRVTQIDDAGGRANLHVDLQVDLVK